MEIVKTLKEKACSVSLSARTKKECLLELSRLITDADQSIDLGELLAAFEKREAQGSTGLGRGIAIPHARLKHVRGFTLGIAVSKKGIDFESVDRKRTYIYFVIVGPDDRPEEYLRLLAIVSRVVKNRNTQRELRSAKTPFALRESFLRNLPVAINNEETKGKYKLLTIVLFERRYLDDIIELLIEQGVRGATIQESMGIKEIMSRVPLFADFMNFLGERKRRSSTIRTIVCEREIDSLISGIEDILGDLDTHTGAMVYAVDVSFLKGSMEAI